MIQINTIALPRTLLWNHCNLIVLAWKLECYNASSASGGDDDGTNGSTLIDETPFNCNSDDHGVKDS